MFLTFTSNSDWPEIKENIESYHDALYRPDIEARVFHLKLNELIKDLTINQIFGVSIAYLHVIEFQKRGHPHAHILVTLRDEDKPKTAEIIDKMIRADIPDLKNNPRLHELVKKFMLHGPCTSKSACMQNTKNDKSPKCSKNFPKEFCENTRIDQNRLVF